MMYLLSAARCCALLCLLGALSAQAQRVVLVSFDGLGHQALTQPGPGEELRTIHSTARAGAIAQGMQPAFPSTTANSHAALWTGCYGDRNHVTANTPPLLPRAEHSSTERGNGFQGVFLHADALWVTAAKAGIRSLACQPTQGFPFTAFNSTPGAMVVNGYQTRSFAPHALFTEKDAQPAPHGWLRLHHGPLSLLVRRTAQGLQIKLEGRAASVLVKPAPAELAPPQDRPLARLFSDPLEVLSPVPARLYFRLFSLSPSSFRLYVTPLQELASTEPLGSLFRQAGGFVGNGPSELLSKEKITAPEYLEGVELVIRQLTRHTAWLAARTRARFVQSYLPFPDEFEHEWLGRPDTEAFRRWGYIAVERGAAELAKLAGPSDSLVFVSDHGMAPVSKAVAIGKALHDAGLDGRASYLYNSILVNTTDWKGGSVAPADRSAVVDETRSALARIPAITSFYTPEHDGAALGIGGPAGGDLYFDLQPGYRATGDVDGPLVRELKKPGGVHGFYPLRPEMLAICVVRSPRIAPGTQWDRLRSIAVVPLLSNLLGIAPPAEAHEPSPLR